MCTVLRLGRAPRPVRSAMAATLLLTLGACSADTVPSAAMQMLRFGVLQSVDQLPYFVMRAQGFDARNGLTITETVMQGGTALIEAMAAGTIDVSYPGSIAVLNASRTGVVPDQITVVASVATADADHRAFAVLASSEIHSWADLEGQAIAINQPRAIAEAAIRTRLRSEGVTGTRLISIPLPNQGLAVAGGNVAAAVLVEPFITQSLQRGDGHVLDWVVGGGAPFPEFEESVVTFSNEYIDAHPDGVRAFLRAQLQAVRWIADHESEARSLLAERLGLSAEVGAQMNLVRWPLDARNDVVLLSRIRDVLIQLEPSPMPSPIIDLIDTTFLDALGSDG